MAQKLLILGGAVFMGRHVVDAARAVGAAAQSIAALTPKSEAKTLAAKTLLPA